MKNINSPYQKYYSTSYGNAGLAQANEMGVRITRSGLSGIPYEPNKKVLDVACGIGRLGQTFSANVWGFDMNPKAIAVAKHNGIRAKLGDAEGKWKYPNAYFDMVLASHIIEHVRNPDELLTEAKRVLKKNGTLVIITPNLAAWFNRILLMLGFQPFFTEVSSIDKTLGLAFTRRLSHGTLPVGHLRVFTLGALTDILRLHGFTIIETNGVEFGAFPAPLRIIDRWFAHVTPLAASLIVIAQKKRN